MCEDDNTISLDEVRESLNHTHIDAIQCTHHEFLDTEEVPDCPFCGENSEDGCLMLYETDDHETWYICCDECMCQGPSSIDREGAIELWAMRDGK